MKTQLLITVEHPDKYPATQFIDIAIKSVLQDINADCEEGWSVNYTDIPSSNYQFLEDFALKCSLEHHLCNVEELLNTNTLDDVLALVEAGSDEVVIYEPYEWCEPSQLVNEIEDARGVHRYNFSELLKRVNGEQWFDNFKGGK